MIEDRRIHRPADHQHQRRRRIEPHHRLHARAVAGGQHHDVAALHLRRDALGRQLDPHAGEQSGRGEHLPGQRIVDHRLGEAAQRRLRAQHLDEHRWIGGQELAGARQVVRHFQRDRADIVAVFVQVAARDLQQLGHRLADRIVEPGLDAEMEERDGEARHQDGGRHRHAAEQQHQPDMQPRAGGTAAALHPHAGEAPGQHGDQQQYRREVGQQQTDADARLQAKWRATCQEDERRKADRNASAASTSVTALPSRMLAILASTERARDTSVTGTGSDDGSGLSDPGGGATFTSILAPRGCRDRESSCAVCCD